MPVPRVAAMRRNRSMKGNITTDAVVRAMEEWVPEHLKPSPAGYNYVVRVLVITSIVN